jgi:hypothetical protein
VLLEFWEKELTISIDAAFPIHAFDPTQLNDRSI